MITAASYSLELSDTIADVDHAAWLSVCPAETDIFMNPGLLAAVETSMSADAKCWYVLFRDVQNRPVAAAVLSSYVIDSTVLATGIGEKIAKAVACVLPHLTRLKILFLGMPFSSGQSHIRFSPQANHQEIIRQLDELLVQKAKETKSEIIVAKEFQDDELSFASLLEQFEYRQADSLPMNYMPAVHNSFEDYQQSVKAKKRHHTQRSRKRLEAGNIERIVCRGEEAAQRFNEKMHKLYENVLFRSKNRSEYLPADFFRELALQRPENVEFLYFYKDNQPVTFVCCLFSQSTYIALYAGIDYEHNREHDLYLNMLYDSMDRGLRSDAQQIWIGANSDEIKQNRLGAYQEPRRLYVKGVSAITKFVLRIGFDHLFPKYEMYDLEKNSKK